MIATGISAELLIEEQAWQHDPAWPDPDGARPHLLLALDATARHMQIGGTIAILLTSDAKMQALNRRWRGQDKATDILAFPAGAAMALMPEDQTFLGDLALGWERFIMDAQELQRPAHLHIRHLLTHGVLHLLGHDHEQPEDAQAMEVLESNILGEIGLPSPYGEASVLVEISNV